MVSSLRPLLALSVILLALTSAAEDLPDLDEPLDANSIVQAALQAEVDGDTSGRQGLLARAIQQDPEHLAARWHSGYVQIDDRWQTIEDAEFSAAAKGVIAAYGELRNRHSGSLAGELSLARWCQKNGLGEQERLHWANVLRFDPKNQEARSRLGVREFRGQLLTVEQIESWKQAEREYERVLRVWNPRLRNWRREIENSASPDQTDAWRQLTSLDDVQAVPSLERMFPQLDSELQRQVVYVLGNIEDQVATDALVRLSLGARHPEIREAAAEQLSDRSWFGFVPNLLGRLETPVECRYFVKTLASRVFSEVRYTQEQHSSVVNLSRSVNAAFRIRHGNAPAYANALAEKHEAVSREASRQYRRVLESLQAVQVKNAQTSMRNERIYAALKTSTGQEIEYRPKLWWDWWRDYNELAAEEEKPEIEYRNSQHYRTTIEAHNMLSCFAAGTAVWTETGPVAIEDVRRGDRVLSQNLDSGELSYRMVLDTTIRPPSPTLRIQVADEHIEATLGHPLWVVGQGWRMAKELKVGDQLHGMRGGVTIDKIESGPTAEAYNLVVADTNTYFVGGNRLLVHDNTARRVLDVPVPGWAPEND